MMHLKNFLYVCPLITKVIMVSCKVSGYNYCCAVVFLKKRQEDLHSYWNCFGRDQEPCPHIVIGIILQGTLYRIHLTGKRQLLYTTKLLAKIHLPKKKHKSPPKKVSQKYPYTDLNLPTSIITSLLPSPPDSIVVLDQY